MIHSAWRKTNYHSSRETHIPRVLKAAHVDSLVLVCGGFERNDLREEQW